jgi:hypothetical protein
LGGNERGCELAVVRTRTRPVWMSWRAQLGAVWAGKLPNRSEEEGSRHRRRSEIDNGVIGVESKVDCVSGSCFLSNSNCLFSTFQNIDSYHWLHPAAISTTVGFPRAFGRGASVLSLISHSFPKSVIESCFGFTSRDGGWINLDAQFLRDPSQTSQNRF